MTGHPGEDVWEQLATGELADDARANVMDHVVSCASCARTWRAVRHVAREARAFDPAVPLAAPNEASGTLVAFRRTRRVLFVAGGGALVAAAVLLLWLRRPTPDAFDHEGVRGEGRVRVELVRASAARLAWRAHPGARHYTIEVFSLDGRPVWRREAVTTTELAVEPPLAPGEYRWQVEAWVEGSRVAVSAPARFAVP
jgi:hypothetical protein